MHFDATPPEAVRTPVPDELETIWDAVRRELRRDVTDFTFHIWLEPLEPAACDQAARSIVRAPEHIRSWVRDRYMPLLLGARSAAPGSPPSSSSTTAGAGPTAPCASPLSPSRRRAHGLNPKYTFEQFVIGDGNRLAHAAALAVAELPAQA